MNILMLGWEYPPNITGGLGVATKGIVSALSELASVNLLLPSAKSASKKERVKIISTDSMQINMDLWITDEIVNEEIKFLEIGHTLLPYLPAEVFIKEKSMIKTQQIQKDTDAAELLNNITVNGHYQDQSLSLGIKKYAMLAVQQAKSKKYDIVHAHDWLTFQAGIAIRKILKIPLVVHFHSTEKDRNGLAANPEIESIEAMAVKESDHIVAVSHKLKNHIADYYEISKEKITVVPNAMDPAVDPKVKNERSRKGKIVGFAGRFTDQKAPLKFVDIARELSSNHPDINFIMVGDGYLMEDIRNKINQLNLNHIFTLTGFVKHERALEMIKSMDLMIMPSVAEPFGLTALEAITLDVPVITSMNCGICDFIPSLHQVSHWDVHTYVEKSVELLYLPETKEQYMHKAQLHAKKLSWHQSAESIKQIYLSLIG